MKVISVILLSLISFPALSQQSTDSLINSKTGRLTTYEPKVLTASISMGVNDAYRTNFSLPPGFNMNSTSGFAPLFAILDYGVNRYLSIAATFSYDNFNFNYAQAFQGYYGNIYRYHTDNFIMYGAGFSAFLHLKEVIRIKRVDPFIGAGLSINNIRHSSYPQGDSLAIITQHVANPYLKVGARYYLSRKCSFFGDLGYDNHSTLSLGLSCRFLSKDNNKFAEWAVVPPPGNKEISKDETKVIQYKLGADLISKASFPYLDSIAFAAYRNPEIIFSVTRFRVGIDKKWVNKRQSHRRAKEVKEYLEFRGVEENRIKLRGNLKTQPVFYGKSKRRVVVNLLYNMYY